MKSTIFLTLVLSLSSGAFAKDKISATRNPQQVGGEVDKDAAAKSFYECVLTNTTWPSDFGKALSEGSGKATVKIATTMASGQGVEFKLSNNRYARIQIYYGVFGPGQVQVELQTDESSKFDKMPLVMGTAVNGLQSNIFSSSRYFAPGAKDRYEDFKLTCELKTK